MTSSSPTPEKVQAPGTECEKTDVEMSSSDAAGDARKAIKDVAKASEDGAVKGKESAPER